MSVPVEVKYEYTSPQESVILKDWAAGTSHQIESTEYIYDGADNMVMQNVTYSPAWLKAIIDEPLVNAIDHYIRCYDTNTPVTEIKVKFNTDGSVYIYNDGPGVEVEYHTVGKMYAPQLIFGELHQGEHKRKDNESITGGTNGLGAKLANCFSNEFTLETVDAKGRTYVQRWEKHMEIVNTPSLDGNAIPLNRRNIPHTLLIIRPDYTLFHYKSFTKEVYDTLLGVVRTRMLFAASFAKYANSIRGHKKPLRVIFNDVPMAAKTAAEMAVMMFGKVQLFSTIVEGKSPFYKYPWEVCIAMVSKSSGKNISNVNGIVVRSGKHIKYIQEQIITGVKADVAKLLHDRNVSVDSKSISSNIVILLNTQIPGANWTGQRKDTLTLHNTDLKYQLDKKVISGIAMILRDNLIGRMLDDNKVTKTDYQKYRPARYARAGTKNAIKCCLLCAEGDSAMSQLVSGVSACLGFNYYGLISMGGVIVNARKECDIIETATGPKFKKSKKLSDNKFINAFMEVLGLRIGFEYDPKSPNYNKEIAKLNYGCVIICVDQDLDGVNIMGLLLSLFELFWPKLLAADFVKRMETPIQRAFPKSGGKVVEFYNDAEYSDWVDTGIDTSKYKIDYFKGLGTHSERQTLNMFKNFHEHLHSVKSTADLGKYFNIYYGSVPDLRKIELSKELQVLTIEELRHRSKTRSIDCEQFLRKEVNGFQKYNLLRKLDSAIDGMNISGRKIYDGCVKIFRNSNNQMKVTEIAGYVSFNEEYHHGEGSLFGSITGKAFVAPGGKQLPQLVPQSNFGSRLAGGADAAAPRYIKATFNKKINDLLYPQDDYCLLQFTINEGKRTEPVYFIPIIPTACLESTEIPAHGWKLKTYGRDAIDVIKIVRAMITIGDDIEILDMRPCVNYWKGEIRNIRGVETSVGIYEYISNNNQIHITELPLRVWTNPYVENLIKGMEKYKHIYTSVTDYSDRENVSIFIQLTPDGYGLLCDNGDGMYTDGIEEFFGLRKSMKVNLNMLGSNYEVIEFKKYNEIVKYWFPFRKKLYMDRISREIVVMEAKITREKNIIRYIETSNVLQISGKPKATQISILEENKFDKLWISGIDQIQFMSTEDLKMAIYTGEEAQYKYLLNLTDGGKSKESLRKRIDGLANIERQLHQFREKSSRGRFPGAEIWLDELNKLERMIEIGVPNRWDYENKYTY